MLTIQHLISLIPTGTMETKAMMIGDDKADNQLQKKLSRPLLTERLVVKRFFGKVFGKRERNYETIASPIWWPKSLF